MSYQLTNTVKTGRSRTIKFSGSWTGSWEFYTPTSSSLNVYSTGHGLNAGHAGICGFDFMAGKRADSSVGADYAGYLGDTISGLPEDFFETFMLGGIDNAIKPMVTPITPLSLYDYGFVPYVSGKKSYSLGGTGKWDTFIDVEEYFDVFIEIDDNTGQPTYPSYGGVMTQEPPFSNKIVFYERGKIGGLVGVNASFTSSYPTFLSHGNVFSIACRASISDYFVVPYNTAGALACAAMEAQLPSITDTITSTLTAKFDNNLSTYSISNNFDSVRDNAGVGNIRGIYSTDGNTHNLSVTKSSQLPNPASEGVCFVSYNVDMSRNANVEARVYVDKDDYPDDLNVLIAGDNTSQVITTGKGNGAGTIEQGFVDVTNEFEFKASIYYKYKPITVNYDTRDTVAAWASPGALLRNREPKADWRTMWRGIAFQATALSQKSTRAVDSAIGITATDPNTSFPGSWSASSPATIVSNPTYLTITTGNSMAGSVSRSFNDEGTVPGFRGACFGGYRYLKFNIRASKEAAPFTIGLVNEDGTKTWNKLTGANGTFVDVVCDIANPDSETAATDNTDSQWPLVGDSNSWHIKDGHYTGVTHVQSLTITGLQKAITYDLTSISLYRNSNPLISIAPAWNSMVDEYDNDPLSKQLRVRLVGANTDGVQSLEATDLRLDVLGNLTEDSITTVCSSLNLIRNGFTSTAATSFPDSYHTNALDAVHLHGMGALIAPTKSGQAPGWVSGFDFNQDK